MLTVARFNFLSAASSAAASREPENLLNLLRAIGMTKEMHLSQSTQRLPLQLPLTGSLNHRQPGFLVFSGHGYISYLNVTL